MVKVSIKQALKHARKLAKSGEQDQAIALYERVLQAEPNNKRAQAELNGVRPNSTHYSPAASNGSQNDRSMKELTALIAEKAYKVAAQKAETLITTLPRSAALWNAYAAALQGDGQFDAATRAFEKAVALAPGDSRIKLNLARHYGKLGQIDKEIKQLQETLLLEPNWKKAHVMIAAAFKRNDQVESALPHLERAAELDPKDAVLLNNLGAMLHMNDQTAIAISYLENAIKMDSSYAEAYYNLGIALEAQGNIKEAIAQYQKSVDLNPKNPTFWFNLASAHFLNQEYNACLSCLEKTLALDPNHPKAKKAKGQALLERGDIDEAQNFFNVLLEEFPDDADFHYYLGRIYNYQGDVLNSVNSFLQSFIISPISFPAVASLLTKPEGTLPKKTIEKLTKVYESVKNSLPQEKREFAKAHILRHIGDIDRAWEYYIKANSTVFLDIKTSAKCTIIDQHQALARLQKRMSPEIKNDKTLPVSLFILAPSRSGKTSLEYILGTSSQVKRSYENKRFNALIYQSAQHFGLRPAGRLEALTAPAKEEFSLLYKDLIRDLSNACPIITDTSPHRIFNAWDIANLIPNSYFVFVERDPWDTAIAIFQKHYKNDGNFYAYHPDTIRDHLIWYRNMRDTLMGQLGKRAIKIQYTDLMSNPESVLAKLDEFLGKSLDCQVPDGFRNGFRNTSAPYRELMKAIPKEASLDFLFDT